ncbi:MAG: hypothetical protein GX483_09215 [Actinomycetaceae bacterium]|nr:hypothetical protein [Actinomycetaceae bacterium]
MYVLPKCGEFITGVCHPGNEVALIKSASIGWSREDIPFPFERGTESTLTPRYIKFRDRVKRFSEAGIKSMCITPYPRAFVQYGVDPSTKEGLEVVKRICTFLATDLGPLGAAGFQITNELNVFHFRVPLSLEQAPDFIIAGLQGVNAGYPEAILGYNIAGISETVLALISAIEPYHGIVDYMGLDSYKGTWSDGEPEDILAEVDATYEATKLPVVLQEFGFSSVGEIFTETDVSRYLNDLGFSGVADVFADPLSMIKRMPYQLATRVLESPEEDWAVNCLGFMPHLLRKWPGGSRKYRHTVEGQAAFYNELMSRLLEHPHIAGTIIFSWKDAEVCFNCSYPNCPCETGWGITDSAEKPKPAYYVIKEHFQAIGAGC